MTIFLSGLNVARSTTSSLAARGNVMLISGVPSSGGSGCASGSVGGVGTPDPTTDSASGSGVAVGIGVGMRTSGSAACVGCNGLAAPSRSLKDASGVGDGDDVVAGVAAGSA